MARPLSDEKRQAILRATIEVIAEHGVGGPIAKIAQQAGVAEGTIFTYFTDKDALLNAAYLAAKEALASAMMTGLPSSLDLRERCRYVWDHYVEWGARHPQQRKAMNQLTVSDRITAATRQQGALAFQEIQEMLREIHAGGILREQPLAFVAAIMESLAQTTLGFIASEADEANLPAVLEIYQRGGFEAFWGAVSRPPS